MVSAAATVTWRRALEVGMETRGQIWVMLHFGLAAGGGGRCKDDGGFLMGPWSETGEPEGGATPVWPPGGDVKRVVG